MSLLYGSLPYFSGTLWSYYWFDTIFLWLIGQILLRWAQIWQYVTHRRSGFWAMASQSLEKLNLKQFWSHNSSCMSTTLKLKDTALVSCMWICSSPLIGWLVASVILRPPQKSVMRWCNLIGQPKPTGEGCSYRGAELQLLKVQRKTESPVFSEVLQSAWTTGFCHSPVDFRAHSRAYPHSLPLTSTHSRMCWCRNIYGRMTKAEPPKATADIWHFRSCEHSARAVLIAHEIAQKPAIKVLEIMLLLAVCKFASKISHILKAATHKPFVFAYNLRAMHALCWTTI